jgi:hypothetical protein
MKKRLILLIVALIVFTMFFFFVYFFIRMTEKNTNQSNEHQSSIEVSSFKAQCMNMLKNSIIGKWNYLGGEAQDSPSILISKDNTFKFIYNDTTIVSEGDWEYNDKKNSILFKFLKYDSQWISILDSDLSLYPNIENYSPKDKYLELKIIYLPDPSTGAFTKCEEDRFALDLFNMFVYKQSND